MNYVSLNEISMKYMHFRIKISYLNKIWTSRVGSEGAQMGKVVRPDGLWAPIWVPRVEMLLNQLLLV